MREGLRSTQTSSTECRPRQDAERCLMCGTRINHPRCVRGANRKWCGEGCRKRAWDKAHPRQAVIRVDPTISSLSHIGIPPYSPAKRKALNAANLRILRMLKDGRAYSVTRLMEVGGYRYSARIAEIRAAGHRILGPRQWGHELETEPMRGLVEMYRLVR